MSAGTTTEELRIELLGGFRIALGADEIPDDGWRLAKARSLVKIVALAPGQSILREQLVDLLWPELDPGAGSNNLHQALHIARRTLGALFPDTKPNRILRLQRGVLSLEAPIPLWIDVEVFELEARALQSIDDPASFYPTLDIYRGDLLPDDLYEDWAAERRIALHEQYLSLLDRLAALHRAKREATPAIDALRRVVAIEPDREEAHRGLMELYALTGRRQQAIRQYERAREILERELELEPEPETDDLYDAILSGTFPAETWEIEAAEPQPVSRPEITESIADFLGRAGDFVGRSEELGTLQNALERVIGDEGEIILVAGEAGIGKTRMSEEFLRYASAQGVRTLWGRCYEGDGAPAYWPWVQVVRSYMEGRSTAELRTVMGPGAADIARIAPELRERLPDLEEPPPLDPDGERFRLFDSMTTFLKNAAERAPLALIIDDLHSADRSSLLLLEFLAREIAETGLLIVGTYRHVEVDRGHPLTRTLGQLARHEANERITLEGLSVADIDRYIELVTGRAAPEGLAAAIHEQTEGNPFFVREIVALLIEEERLNNPEDVRSWRLTIPHGIRETIALRTARLTDTAHRVLTTASVSGRDFELPIVAQVADLDELDTLDALEEALGTGLIIESPPTPGGFRFTHAITRQTLYDDLSQARRLRMHLRTGEAIETSSSEAIDGHLSDLAYHFAASASLGVVDQAIHYLRRAARQATERVAYAEAATYLQRAVGIQLSHAQPEDAVHCDLLLQLGEALNATGDSTDAQAAFEHAVKIARSLSDGRRLALAAIGTFEAGYYSAYFYRQFVDLLEEGLQGLTDEDPDLRVAVLSRLATALQDSPDENERMRLISDRAVRIANEHEVLSELPFAMYSRFLAYWSPADCDNALESANDLVRVAERARDTRMTLMGHAWRTFHLVERGDFTEADEAIAAYGNIVSISRQRHYEWAHRLRLAMRKLMTGPLDDAEEAVQGALEAGVRTWPEPARSNHFQQMFFLRRLQGRSAELIEQGHQLSNTYPDMPIWKAMLANLYLDIEQIDQGREQAKCALRDGVDALPKDYFWLTNVALLAEACSRMGRYHEVCEELIQKLEPFHNRFVSPGTNAVCLGPMAYYLAYTHFAQDNAREALHYVEKSQAAISRSDFATFQTFIVQLQRTLGVHDERVMASTCE